jgi:hypothetical protein
MKIRKYFALIFIICINTFCKAQFATLSMTQQNIVYLGVDNPFQVAVSNYPVSSIRVKVNNGTITGKNGEYTFRANQTGITNINVEVVKKGKIKSVSSFPIKVKEINDCYARVGNYKNSFYPLNEFKVQLGLIIELSSEYGFDAKIMPVSYKSIIIKDSTKQSFLFDNNGAYFCKAFKEEIQKLDTNDKIIIYEIKGMFPNGKVHKVEPLVYTII